MKKCILAVMAMLCAMVAWCDEAEKVPMKTVNYKDLRIINKGFENSERTFSRLPVTLKDSARADLWERQQCSAGMGLRFATDSRSIGVRYDLFYNTHMIHMADTGL